MAYVQDKKYTLPSLPKHVEERNRLAGDHFNKVLEEITDALAHNVTSLIAQNNNINALMSPNFHTLPGLHRFYFDDMVDDVLYVKDGLNNDKLIRKDEALLLQDGFFTKKSSVDCITLNDTKWAKILIDTKINPSTAKFFEGKIVSLGGNAFALADHTKLTPYYTLGDLSVGLNHLLLTALQKHRVDFEAIHTRTFWRDTAILGKVFNSIRDSFKMFTDLDQVIPLRMRHSSSGAGTWITMPADSPFGEVLVSVSIAFDMGKFKRGPTDVQNRETIFINSPTQTGIWHNEMPRLGTRDRRHHVLASALGFDHPINNWLNILIYNPDPLPLEEPLPTENNQGELMTYNDNVLDYKVGFKVTEAEKTLFDTSTYQKPIFLGVELECTSRSNRNTVIKNIANSPFGDHCIIKFDRSIDDGGPKGMEIVTIPATLAYHKQAFSDHFFTSLERGEGFDRQIISNNHCGIHVHVGKESFTPLSVGKFITFLNSVENRDFIRKMAGRDIVNNHYTVPWKLKGKNNKGIDTSCAIAGTMLKRVKSISSSESRKRDNKRWKSETITDFTRGAVHVGKAKTIEVRIFKSTTTKTNLLRKLEFVHALVKFANSGVSTQDLTVKAFLNFILDKSMKKDYPYLLRWLSSPGKEYIVRTSAVSKKTNKKFFRYEHKEQSVKPKAAVAGATTLTEILI